MKNIIKFLFKRISASFVTILLIITITFLLLHKLPGDPFEGEKAIPPQIKANLMQK